MRLKLATVSGPSIWAALLAALLWLGTAVPARADVIYAVEEGDSAWSIAVHFGISLDELYAANGWAIDQDPVLQIGQCLNIPAPSGADQAGEANPDSEVQPDIYLVQAGDNPFLISQQFHIGTLALLEYNQLTENDLLTIGQTLKIPPSDYVYQGNAESAGAPVGLTPEPEPLKYTVVEGDNAWSIARRFGVTVQGLLSHNNLSDSSLLHIGDELKIPPGEHPSEPGSRLLEVTHVVTAGETIDSIARIYGVSRESVIEANGLSDDTALSSGQEIRIPGARGVPGVEGVMEDLSGELQPLPGLGGTGAWRSEIFDFGQIPAPRPSTPDLDEEASRGQWNVDGYFEDGRPYHKYTIRRGDTLSAVAHTFDVTQSDLMNRNGLDSRSMLRIGRDLKIPLDLPSAPRPGSSGPHPSPSPSIHVGAPHAPIGTSEGTASGRAVVEEAMKHLGTPYVWSGSSLTGGADCSGFTMAVYALFGISLPHAAREQAGSGVAVDYGDLQPGDLVFFHTTRSGISHAGMYIGGGEFIHSSSHRGGVVISPLDTGYYNSRFVCARRVL
jgi:peptidoglycan endopeptidase LytE